MSVKKKRIDQSKILKLNLGSGSDKKPGFVNLDIDPQTKPDAVHDLTKPLPYPAHSAQEVLLQDVLEHLTKEQAEKLLKEISRVLVAGGKLVVRVPMIDSIIKKFHHHPDIMMLFLYGDTSKNGVWGAHKYGYTPEILGRMCAPLKLEIKNTTKVETNYLFELEKVRKIESRFRITGHGWWPRSLIRSKKIALGSYIVCTDWVTYVWVSLTTSKKIIWVVSREANSGLTKLVLRKLSRKIEYLIVRNQRLAVWSREVLRFSHLRTLQF